MTTTVVVKANHGWPVRVTTIDKNSAGEPVANQSEPIVVPPDGEHTTYVTSTRDLLIHEIQPDEIEQPPEAA